MNTNDNANAAETVASRMTHEELLRLYQEGALLIVKKLEYLAECLDAERELSTRYAQVLRNHEIVGRLTSEERNMLLRGETRCFKLLVSPEYQNVLTSAEKADELFAAAAVLQESYIEARGELFGRVR